MLNPKNGGGKCRLAGWGSGAGCGGSWALCAFGIGGTVKAKEAKAKLLLGGSLRKTAL